MEKALSRLPKEPVEVESDMQRILVQRLSDMRYNPPPTTRAPRPRKTDKLPAGTAYTCSAKKPNEKDPAEDTSEEDSPEEDSPDEEEGSIQGETDSSVYEEEDEERSRKVKEIVKRVLKKKARIDDAQDQLAEELIGASGDQAKGEQHANIEQPAQDVQPAQEDQPTQDYSPGSFIVSVYQNDWYVGEVVSKEGEPEAVEGEEYIFVSFMEKTSASGECWKWPRHRDLLNTLKSDVLFQCQPPAPCPGSSSSRSMTFGLSKSELKKAKTLFHKFLQNQAYYPTKITLIACNISMDVCVILFWEGVGGLAGLGELGGGCMEMQVFSLDV